jgi:hypothetical protein
MAKIFEVHLFSCDLFCRDDRIGDGHDELKGDRSILRRWPWKHLRPRGELACNV